MSYYTKITKAGLAAITAAMNNNSKVPITYMAFGDGNGYIPEPDENATSLVKEVYRVGVNKVEVHNKNPNWLVCEAIIPSAVGGFNIREVALYDSTGNTMLAIASYPPTYKPTVEEGAAKIQTIRIVIQVDNSGNFELIVDPDVVLVTHRLLEEEIDKKTPLSLNKFGITNLFDIDNRIGIPETHKIQQYFNEADSNRYSSVDLCLDRFDYLIDQTIIVQEPITVFGRSGTTYGRGKDKKGSIVVARGLDVAFDLGNSRTWEYQIGDDWIKTSSNPADHWEFNHVRVQTQDLSESNLSQTAFKHTTATDGPDRGINFVGVSARGFGKVIHFVDNGGLTQAATVNIESCVLSNNKKVVVADNCVYGLRFVNNQAEQCKDSIISGKFSAGITIENNMLEGNYNCIDLKSNLRVGYSPQITIGSNYFEWNKGDYVMSFEGAGLWDTSFPEIHINPNFGYELETTDYARFSERSLVKYNDNKPATLMYGFDGVYGTKLTNDKVNHFIVRSNIDGSFNCSISQNPNDLTTLKDSEEFNHFNILSDKTIKIDGHEYAYINNYYKGFDGFKPTTEYFEIGDVIEVNFLLSDIYSENVIKSHFAIGAYDDANGDVVFQLNSVGSTKSDRQLTVVTGVCTVSKNKLNPTFRFFSVENHEMEGKLLGISYRNHKKINTNTINITPRRPYIKPIDNSRLIFNKNITLSIIGNKDIYIEVSLENSNVSPSDFINVSVSDYLNTKIDYSAKIVSEDLIGLYVMNKNSVDINSITYEFNFEIKKT